MAKDFLFRDLTESGAADFMGRDVTEGKDYAGRGTIGDWAAEGAVALGDLAVVDGSVLRATTAGTTAATAPDLPGYGETVEDGTAEWLQVS